MQALINAKISSESACSPLHLLSLLHGNYTLCVTNIAKAEDYLNGTENKLYKCIKLLK